MLSFAVCFASAHRSNRNTAASLALRSIRVFVIRLNETAMGHDFEPLSTRTILDHESTIVREHEIGAGFAPGIAGHPSVAGVPWLWVNCRQDQSWPVRTSEPGSTSRLRRSRPEWVQ
jgi:hypothetical protein